MKQEQSSRMAATAGTGTDMGIPDRVIGSGRSGRARSRRIKVIVRHRATTVPVSTGSARSLPPDGPAPLEPARC
ncbi:hypothetical protein ACIO8G_01905 [Streptomyces sp. NPDC087219]|uniref:hypothetical protein n=1 Tax=Streptomyces sp. NPDC087219 TaxID=3365770 RepID=UPI003821BBC0